MKQLMDGLFQPHTKPEEVRAAARVLAGTLLEQLVRHLAERNRVDLLTELHELGRFRIDPQVLDEPPAGASTLREFQALFSPHAHGPIDALGAFMCCFSHRPVAHAPPGQATQPLQGMEPVLDDRPQLYALVRQICAQTLEELHALDQQRKLHKWPAPKRGRLERLTEHTCAVIGAMACALNDGELLERAIALQPRLYLSLLQGPGVSICFGASHVNPMAPAVFFNSHEALEKMAPYAFIGRWGASQIDGGEEKDLLPFDFLRPSAPINPKTLCMLLQKSAQADPGGLDADCGGSGGMVGAYCEAVKDLLSQELFRHENSHLAAHVLREHPQLFDLSVGHFFNKALSHGNLQVVQHLLGQPVSDETRRFWVPHQDADGQAAQDGRASHVLSYRHAWSRVVHVDATQSQAFDSDASCLAVMHHMERIGQADLLLDPQLRCDEVGDTNAATHDSLPITTVASMMAHHGLANSVAWLCQYRLDQLQLQPSAVRQNLAPSLNADFDRMVSHAEAGGHPQLARLVHSVRARFSALSAIDEMDLGLPASPAARFRQ